MCKKILIIHESFKSIFRHHLSSLDDSFKFKAKSNEFINSIYGEISWAKVAAAPGAAEVRVMVAVGQVVQVTHQAVDDPMHLHPSNI